MTNFEQYSVENHEHVRAKNQATSTLSTIQAFLSQALRLQSLSSGFCKQCMKFFTDLVVGMFPLTLFANTQYYIAINCKKRIIECMCSIFKLCGFVFSPFIKKYPPSHDLHLLALTDTGFVQVIISCIVLIKS